MFQLCQHKPAAKCISSKPSNKEKMPVKQTVSGSSVVQMYCAYCGRDDCVNGSICGHREPVRGTYGYRRQDQRDFGTSGRTHEAEHAVGFAPANQNNNFPRNSRMGRAYENALPAYQEERGFHRQHIGTGNRLMTDASGFNANTYRDTQQALVESGDYATAVQINQLGYAYMPGFQHAPMGTAADLSFIRMAHVPFFPVPNRNAGGYYGVPRTEEDRVEMEAARFTARTGHYPTESDLYRIQHEVGRRGQKVLRGR